MKKVFSVFLSFVLVFCFSFSSFAWFTPINTNDARDAFSYYFSMEYFTDVLATLANGGTVDAGVYSGDNSVGVVNNTNNNSLNLRNGSADRSYYLGNSLLSNNNMSNSFSYDNGDTINLRVLDLSRRTLNIIDNSVTNNYTTNVYNKLYYNQTNNIFQTQIDNHYYYIQYNPTYVTVVSGSNADDARLSKYYFELPDGRNSSELTANDVKGMLFCYTAGNYNEVLEDNGVLALFHFDANKRDSGPFNLSLDETFGASLSYADNGSFNQAIQYNADEFHRFYVSSNEIKNINKKAFTVEMFLKFNGFSYTDNFADFYNRYGIDLTSNRLDRDFGRYYINSFVGADVCYHLNKTTAQPEYFFIRPTGIPTSSIDAAYLTAAKVSPGTWYHFAIVYDGNNLRYYKNGLKIYEQSNPSLQGYSIESRFAFQSGKYSEEFTYSAGKIYNWSYGATFVVDELRICSRQVYSNNFTPPSAPHDTSLVLVLPNDANENMIAVKSNISVSGLRVGGVRPTIPTVGFVYIPIESGKLVGAQIYDGSKWTSVDSRLYLGSEWTNVAGLLVAPVDSTVPPDSSSSEPPSNSSSEPSGNSSSEPSDSGGGFFDWDISGILDFIESLLNMIIAPINTLFSVLSTLLDTFVNFGGEFSSFLASCFLFIPKDLLDVITLGVILMIAASFIKFLRG